MDQQQRNTHEIDKMIDDNNKYSTLAKMELNTTHRKKKLERKTTFSF